MKIPDLKGGELLPLVESFYTIQGEGYNTGKAAYFIRLGGCDVGCSWCDVKESWNPSLHPPVSYIKIIEDAIASGSRSIVITGGEPLSYPLDKLCKALKDNGFEIFLETSGSKPVSGIFDWICLSPKKKKPPLNNIYPLASELKVIIEKEEDFLWAENNRIRVNEKCRLYLQPEWSRREIILPAIISYVKSNPAWSISLQTHKYINIP
ncbi:MAG: 7-carboxy-7-deazaguanine synthase QueE [Bacteroidales bacterium]|nr:7-carboxy-7-deazaguanine synthase QueE [Bacteroidales bacterium]